MLQVFRTYAPYVSGGGIDADGLQRTYDDGAGNIDRDFDIIYTTYGSGHKQQPVRYRRSQAELCLQGLHTGGVVQPAKTAMRMHHTPGNEPNTL